MRGEGTRRGLMAGAGGLALVLASAACEPQLLTPAPPARPAGTVLHVDVLGDSLVRQSAPWIEATVAASGSTVSVASQPGVDLSSPFMWDRLVQVSSRPGDVVVLATATNDAVVQWWFSYLVGPVDAQASYRWRLGRVAEILHDRCLVVVNGRENVNAIYHPDQAVQLNTLIRDEAAVRGNVVVVDWAATSRAHGTDWFADDLLHFGTDTSAPADGSAGARAYATALGEGVARCTALLLPAT